MGERARLFEQRALDPLYSFVQAYDELVTFGYRIEVAQPFLTPDVRWDKR